MKEFEVIICDDGSTDNTYQIVNDYSDKLRLKYLKITNSGGPAAPRNEGIKCATGIFCAFLDVDDLWYPNKLSIVYKKLNEGYDWVYHDLDIVRNDKIIGKALARDYDKSDAVKSLLINFNPIATSSLVIRTTLIKGVGLFNTETVFNFVEDFDYWIRLVSKNTNSFPLKISLGVYSDHENNNSKSLLQIEKLGKLYETYNLKKDKSIEIAKFYAQFIISYKIKNKKICSTILNSMFKINPFHIYTAKAIFKRMKM